MHSGQAEDAVRHTATLLWIGSRLGGGELGVQEMFEFQVHLPEQSL